MFNSNVIASLLLLLFCNIKLRWCCKMELNKCYQLALMDSWTVQNTESNCLCCLSSQTNAPSHEQAAFTYNVQQILSLRWLPFCAFWPQTVNGRVPPMDVICDNKNRPCVLKLKLTYFFLAFPLISFTFLHTQTLLSAPVSVHYRTLFNNFEFMLPLSITSC